MTAMKRFVTTVAAAATALALMTAAAFPARAGNGNGDAVKLLAGIAAIVIIDDALRSDRKRKNSRESESHDDRRQHGHKYYDNHDRRWHREEAHRRQAKRRAGCNNDRYDRCNRGHSFRGYERPNNSDNYRHHDYRYHD